MANPNNINFSVKKQTGSSLWTVTVKYNAAFNNFEKSSGMQFKERVRLWEDDPVDNDLLKTVWGGLFDPATNTVARTITFTIGEGKLDTEWGEEELFVKVKIWNDSLGFWTGQEGSSGTLHLDI
jgi:hypothetical protein